MEVRGASRMSKFLRRWWTNTYELEPQVKIKSDFRLLQHEGMLTDENELLIDNIPIIGFEAGYQHPEWYHSL
jgi:hypothetical protein